MSNNTDSSALVRLFEPFDKEWESATRSIRIDGTVTSVRLENFYWRIVSEIAAKQNLQVPQVMTQLSKVAKSGETKHTNFTSFVRVCCGRYLDRRDNQGESSTDTSTDTNEVPVELQIVADKTDGSDGAMGEGILSGDKPVVDEKVADE